MAIVQYPGKHSKILATIFLLLPTVLNSRVSHYSGCSHYFFPTFYINVLCKHQPQVNPTSSITPSENSYLTLTLLGSDKFDRNAEMRD